MRGWLARYYEKRDLVELGATQRGADPLLDRALEKLPAIDALLRQEQRSLPLPELIERLPLIRQLIDDRGTVAVPDSTQDLSILNGG